MIVIFNPIAGRRRAHLLWRVLDVLAENGVWFELAETRRPGHASELAREAAGAGAKSVVAAGGDGTIVEVANGLMGTAVRLGVIPLGTANVLAQDLGLPFTPRGVAAALAFGRTHRLWPGSACGSTGDRLFVQMLGAGLDAQVVHRLPAPLKRSFGRGAYVLQTLRELARYRFTPLELRIDGIECYAASVIVSKGRLYAGRYTLAPDARSDLPGFTVALFPHGGALAAMAYGAALPLNLLPHAPGIRLVHASRVEIACSRCIPAQADGDAAGTTPVAIRDATAPIEIIIGSPAGPPRSSPQRPRTAPLRPGAGREP
jgi:YegS/Rv2252/BmrU family lipid kinase